jgi:general secretion pathway protein D
MLKSSSSSDLWNSLKFMKRLLSLIFLCVALDSIIYAQNVSTPPPVQNQNTQTTNASAEISSSRIWNFENADIRTVISAVSKETGKNFIIDPRVQGKVTLISNSTMDKNEVYQIFLTLLQTYGYLAIPDANNVIKIVPDSVAKYQDVPAVTGKDELTGSAVMVKVIPVNNGTAEQFVSLVRPLLPSSSEVSAYPPNNALIISSTASKINEIEKIIHTLDVPNPGTIDIVSLKYANANEVANSLKTMLPTNTPGRTPITISADNSSNSILISGSPQDRENIRGLIRKMDNLTVEASKINSTVVVNLRYLNAKDFAPILQNIATGNTGTPSSSSSSSSGSSDSSNSSLGGSSLNSISSLRSMYTNSSDKSSNNNSSNSTGSGSSSSSGASGGNMAGINIQAEPATNSLIIDGSPAQIRALQSVIKQLDVKPQQVLVEAFIAEVNESTMQKLGVKWGTNPPSADSLAAAASNGNNNGNSGQTSSSSVPDFDNGFSSITGGLGVGIVDSGRIHTLITAIMDDSSTNILSTPSLVVLDNEEADLSVGQNISFSNGSAVNTASNSTIVNSVQPTDVALSLKVTPQISQNDAIRLKLEHENDVPTSQKENGNPIVNKSKFTTNVMVNSGQILVIGGLIQNDTEESIQRVPFLSKIPLLGRLFQYRDDTVTKKNLLVFLRPVVLNDENDANRETISRYSLMRELQLDRKRNEDILLPKGGNGIMPQWPSTPLPEPYST